MPSADTKWQVWNDEQEYGDVFYRRATAELPEMESSKAVTKHLARIAKPGDTILDVGCGAGHYLRSLVNSLPHPFGYYGVDATPGYIALARKAWADFSDKKLMSAQFQVSNIYDIKLDAAYADIVMCNNVLLHLPSIEQPLKELVRVAKKYVVLRTFVGTQSFRIKQVVEPEIYGADGEPENYFYYNIYSENYVRSVLSALPGVAQISIMPDHDYDPKNISRSEGDYKDLPKDITTTLNGLQINHYIILPWSFVIVEKQAL